MNITIPDLCLVVLVGASGSGKSTFARRHFLPTEVISSDFCRGLVSDDENNQAATNDAFELLHIIAAKRLALGKLVAIDATNVQPEARKPLVALARQYHVQPIAIVLDTAEAICQQRNSLRPDRSFGPHVVRNHIRSLRQSIRNLQREGFRYAFVLREPAEIEAAGITREPLWTDKRTEPGPFDIVGDIHGCYDELLELLDRLGYRNGKPPEGRKAVFLGDLVDRGPKSPDVLKLVMDMVERGDALCVPGNHDVKLLRKLGGRDVKLTHGLAETMQQLEGETEEFRRKVAQFIDSLVGHYVLAGGKLVVAHAGMKAEMQGRASGAAREFALYGETTGETDEFGLPIRYDWAAKYRGSATVVYGHTPVPNPEWLNNTINIDTGCVFGGSLTALRWPENELVSVLARETYAEPMRPFLATIDEPTRTAQQIHDDVLDIADVIGKRIVTTRLHGNVTIREENAIAALEVMSRFAVDPRWLIYLPPTMSPSETTLVEGLLEHPLEAFTYFRNQGLSQVVCEEKHMGSRAVVVVCRDEAAAFRRFGIEGSGTIYTRTGRRFFDNTEMEAGLLSLIREAMTRSGLWEELNTDWLCLDCELMPWSAKAQELLRSQYAAVGSAASKSLSMAVELLLAASERSTGAAALAEVYSGRLASAEKYVDAYRRYCWRVDSLADLKLAPFHVLATEGGTFLAKDHLWHMATCRRLAEAADGVLISTQHRIVELSDSGSVDESVAWWEGHTERGGEGMVVKPLEFIVRGPHGMVQPGVKCRGREYLRIIYGPEYTAPENLSRLRSRGLGRKRSLALREFALGVESLERFVRYEPLRRVHECVFGVLAMESEPVDPRL